MKIVAKWVDCWTFNCEDLVRLSERQNLQLLGKEIHFKLFQLTELYFADHLTKTFQMQDFNAVNV